MPCQEGSAIGELEWVSEYAARDPGLACRGPLVHIGITPRYAVLAADAVRATPLHEVLWESSCEANPWAWDLCVAHWLDVAYLIGRRGIRGDGTSWLVLSNALIRAVVDMLGWDRKEIANLQRWRELARINP